jgi:enoyl-CoA hydratase/carnithine racemase
VKVKGMKIHEYADGRLRLHEGQIARIEINAPKRRNAISRAMWEVLPSICQRIASNEEVRAVLLSASPDAGGIFCAGADISEFDAVYADMASTRAYNALVRLAQQALRTLPRPVIAVIGGACVGGGCGLALAADLRFASTEARFAITPARLGIAYSPEDTAQLIEKVGPARAKDILFSGRMLSAQEALSFGLVDRVLAPAELDTAAQAYAQEIARLSSESIRTAKAIVNRLSEPDAETCRDLHALFEASFSGQDFAEGRKAFMEKRPPRFR